MTGKAVRMLLALALCTGVGAAASETEACLACHADKGHAIEFPEGERIEAFVDEAEFRASVHGFLACTDCHDRTITPAGHEQRRFRSEELFKLRYSRICRRCHSDEEIAGTEVHDSLLAREADGHAPVCTDCHPAHAVRPAAGGLILAVEEHHCLECHADQAPAAPPAEVGPGDDRARRRVHHNLSCSGCHAGFSVTEHPQGAPAFDGAVPVAPEDICRRCHFDKYTKTHESIHFEMAGRGRPDTPTCLNCHGSHRIVNLSYDRVGSAGKCRECHPKLYATYAASVHGDALVSEHNRDVPICSDCHRAHDIGNPLTQDYRDDIPVMCANCHADAAIVGKYGLSTDVVRTYLSDFHGSTVSIYRDQEAGAYRLPRPIAVCTDCHGTHDIRSMTALGTAGTKALLLTKCRQCHEGAGSDFPDAWLSHYIPSMATAPALYLVDRAYRVLLPLLLLGMLLQVLLHAWRHATGRRGT